MDEMVKAAMRKWPNVPHCHGWLALDDRGEWFMRDESAQRAGSFPEVKGSPVRHEALKAFIQRHYLRDEQGACYFQNGPQRVYVDLAVAPYVWRLWPTSDLGGRPSVRAHTGETVKAVLLCGVDAAGRLYLEADLPSVGRAFGVVHSQDMDAAADELASDAWGELQDWSSSDLDLAERFGFQRRPRPNQET
jgi:Protein of unknown function (DUF2946)